MRKSLLLASLVILTLGSAGSASADPWKDESGHGRYDRHYDDRVPRRHYHGRRYEHRAYKEEYRRGGCKIERKWDRGGYKEEVKCKRRGW